MHHAARRCAAKRREPRLAAATLINIRAGLNVHVATADFVGCEFVGKILHGGEVRALIVCATHREDDKNLAIGAAVPDFIIVQPAYSQLDLANRFYALLKRAATVSLLRRSAQST